MEEFPRNHDATALRLINEVAANREEALNTANENRDRTETDEEVDSSSPIVDHI